MKTHGKFSLTAAPLAVAVSLVLFSGNLRAFGPGGGGNGVGANGGGTSGGVAVGGSAGGGAHGGVSTGGSVSGSSAGSGARSGVSISNSSARAGTFTQGAGIRGNAPVGLSLPYRNVYNAPSAASATRPSFLQSVSRPNNAWSGTAVNPPANTATARTSTRSLYNSNGYTNNRFTGQSLYPGTYGSNLPTTNGWTDRGNGSNGYRNGRSSFRFPGRYGYYPYGYGPAYAPYISYYDGGYPYYGGAYPYSNDVVSNEADVNPGAGNVNPQYVEPGQDANNTQPDPNRAQPPGTAPQNPNASSNATQGTIPNNGPDSLVEAVQQELIRRGYFGGKVDAMFGPETKDALHKFQADHHLAETGLINEATLHALQLD